MNTLIGLVNTVVIPDLLATKEKVISTAETATILRNPNFKNLN